MVLFSLFVLVKAPSFVGRFEHIVRADDPAAEEQLRLDAADGIPVDFFEVIVLVQYGRGREVVPLEQ
jgi:hypothetical protein